MVGIPPIWIHLMRRVAKAVLVYIEDVESIVAEQAEEAQDQDDQDDQGE